MESEDKKIETKVVKVILLGETGVGKTCIINRFITNEFNKETSITLASSYLTKEIQKQNINYNLKIWDTTGQEKYHSVTNLFIKGSNIIILVYSIDSLNSFERLNFWYASLKRNIEDDNYILAVVGNKSDLISEMNVSEEEGKKFAEEKKAIFKLVSAKEDPIGINELFDNLLEELSQIDFESRTESYMIEKKKVKKKKKQKCC